MEDVKEEAKELNDSLLINCPVYGANSDYVIQQTNFWVEGVTLCCVALFGMFGNVFSSLVLSRKSMRSPFNLLLIGLAFFDTVYIFGSVLEAIRKSFRMASHLQLLLFPTLLYPTQMIAMTGSVFMVVAITFERYVSVHHPLDYNQALNDPREIRTRLLKYFVPVCLLSVVLNLPKFFETTAVYVAIEDEEHNVIDYSVQLNVTQMRIDPGYSSFVNWSQLFLLGLIPVILLVYFNLKIYMDVRDRERRRRPPPTLPLTPLRPSGRQEEKLSSPEIEAAAMLEKTTQRPTIDRLTVQSGSDMSNARRRNVEDRMALLFMGIVATYLVCHSPRILLNFYEMLVIEEAMVCSRNGQRAFAVWAQITTSISHLLLVTNSSINILIYSLFNTQFRSVAATIIRARRDDAIRQ